MVGPTFSGRARRPGPARLARPDPAVTFRQNLSRCKSKNIVAPNKSHGHYSTFIEALQNWYDVYGGMYSFGKKLLSLYCSKCTCGYIVLYL